MSELLAIRVQNLRSLRDTGFVELKPITVLVGRNSAGKSTFARVLPLLRQSLEVRKREPVLWWGRFVDFGNFSDSVNRNAETSEIAFGFRVAIDGPGNDLEILAANEESKRNIVEATITLKSKESTRDTILSRIDLIQNEDVYGIHFEEGEKLSRIVVNGVEWSPPSAIKSQLAFGSIIPTWIFLQERRLKIEGREVTNTFVIDALRDQLSFYIRGSAWVHGNTSSESIAELCSQLDPTNKNRLLALMKTVGSGLPTWVASVSGLEISSKRFLEFRNRLMISKVRQLIEKIDEAIVATISKCAYIEPLRATAERYYRRQGLSVAEVDSKGANVPFFLDSLTVTERDKFDAWMNEHLQTGIKTTSEGGHLSIRIRDKSGIEANLADVGFGFSQILPVALQLWSVSQRPSRTRPRIRVGSSSAVPVVIEQPELHLHPEYQSKIADVLASTINSARVALFIETHSPSIINRLGLLVAKEELRRDSVQVLRFERDDSNGLTEIRASEFDAEGVLTNWPFGFFDA